ncbi:hypothetical protein LZ023_35695 (plasmid) [Pseudomonas silvicola]|nr:hypothetical protein LZ023_35695 [Pseudomonas silvicola]
MQLDIKPTISNGDVNMPVNLKIPSPAIAGGAKWWVWLLILLIMIIVGINYAINDEDL